MANPIDELPPLRDIIRDHGLRAEKSLGQNFILDQNLTDKIVRAAGNLSGLNVCEIGPGPGGLTRSILRANPQFLIAIEYDARAISALCTLVEASQGRLRLHEADALGVNIVDLINSPRAIIANLPYNIATPLLIGWLKKIREDADNINHMTLMFQKEVAQRIVAHVGDKTYGRLAVMSQWLCEASICFDLPPSAFVPPPKVTSSVVHFRPRNPEGDRPSFDDMERLVAMAFNQRRKMIRQSLKSYLPAIHEAGIDETRRAETLSLDDFLSICRNAS